MKNATSKTRGLRAIRINEAVCYAALAAAGMIAGSSNRAFANDVTWNRAAGNPGSFGDGANWVGGAVPAGADNAFISNGGIATAAAAVTATFNDLRVGFTPGGSGSLSVTGGTLNATGNMAFGSNQTGAGTLNLSSGQINVGGGTVGDLSIGDDGAGFATIGGGTLSTRFAYIGKSTHGHGDVTQTGGQFLVSRNFVIMELKPADTGAPQTPSSYTMSGGFISVGQEMYVGAHGPATFNLSNTGSINVVSAIHIAASGGQSDPPAGTGTLNMSGGTITVSGPAGYFVVGDHGDGTFNMSSGFLDTKYYNIGQNFEIGFTTRGVVNQTGGSVLAEYAWVIGEQSRSDNLYDLSAGTVTVTGAGIDDLPGDLNLAGGAGGRGTLLVRGTGVANIGNSALVGNAAATNGTLSVSNNGSVALGVNGTGTGFLIVGIDGTGTVLVSGGSVSGDGMTLGQNATGLGTGTQTGGSVVMRGSVSIGEASTKANAYDISAGTLTAGTGTLGGIYVGSTGNGTLRVRGTAVVTAAETISNATAGTGTISVSGGSLTSPAMNNRGAYTQSGGVAALGTITGVGSLTVSGGTLTAASIAQSTLAISSTGFTTITPNGTAAGLSVIGNLTITGTGKLDLNNNDLIVGAATAKSAIETYVKTARNGGAWNGSPGITSTAARNLATTGLGVLSGAEYTSVGGTGTFDGQPYAAGDTLVKYTWNGDANLDGRVTFDDYVKIDTGFNTGRTGWLNGDFNYSGAVNFDDYVLIDIAFNQQNGTLGRAIDWMSGDDRTHSGHPAVGVDLAIGHFEQFGAAYGAAFLSAVPEPASTVAIALAAGTMLRCGRRSRDAAARR